MSVYDIIILVIININSSILYIPTIISMLFIWCAIYLTKTILQKASSFRHQFVDYSTEIDSE